MINSSTSPNFLVSQLLILHLKVAKAHEIKSPVMGQCFLTHFFLNLFMGQSLVYYIWPKFFPQMDYTGFCMCVRRLYN